MISIRFMLFLTHRVRMRRRRVPPVAVTGSPGPRAPGLAHPPPGRVAGTWGARAFNRSIADEPGAMAPSGSSAAFGDHRLAAISPLLERRVRRPLPVLPQEEAGFWQRRAPKGVGRCRIHARPNRRALLTCPQPRWAPLGRSPSLTLAAGWSGLGSGCGIRTRWQGSRAVESRDALALQKALRDGLIQARASGATA